MQIASLRHFALTAAAVLAMVAGPARAQDEAPVVAAAASLKFAVEEIAAAFKADTGQEVKLSMGSTGNFVTQIREGAPFQMFMAADDTATVILHNDGLAGDKGTVYAAGRLALIAPKGSILKPDEAMDNLAALLDEGKITRFAIASPEHAPYGKRAGEALKHRGLWDGIQPYLVLGENVSQAAQFAVSGNAEGGLIAYSLAIAPDVASQGDYVLIPEDWHEPLLQSMVLLNDAGPVAKEFFDYVQSPKAREIMTRYGYALPAAE